MSNEISLPTKVVSPVPDNANRKWLLQYLNNEEIDKYFMYDLGAERHIAPVYQNNKLVYWESRSVTGGSPKAISYGQKPYEILPSRNGECDVLVIVEDYVSAIKVSRFYNTLPLFGSYLPLDKLNNLVNNPKSEWILIWLDHDMFGTSLNMARKLANLGKSCGIINTPKDPKSNTNEEIIQAVEEITLEPMGYFETPA